jgi:hypothetical protein
MKEIMFSLFSVFLIAGSVFCQGSNDMAKEEEAIKALVEESTQAYFDRDISILTATQVTDESFIKLQAYKSGYECNVGWEERLASLNEVLKNNPDPTTTKLKNENYKIKVYPKSAWAVYDQNLYDNEGNFLNMSIQARFLEKVGKDWKIVYLSSVGVTSYEQGEDEDEDQEGNDN